MPGPCAAAHCPNAQSNAANQVALVRKTPRLATVHTTASRMLWRARPIRAFSLRNRPNWPVGRSMLVASFVAVWMHYGRHANSGLTTNWRMSQPPPERLKKGAPNEPPGRNRPGDRSLLRWSGDRGSGFRSRGNGGAATGSAASRASAGTTAERRHVRSCRTGTGLLLWSTGPVSGPTREDILKRVGTSASRTGVLSLRPVPAWILPARPRSAAGVVFAYTGGSAHDSQHGGAGEFRGE